MAYQSYSAYQPNQSHSDALRPTLDTSFVHSSSNNSYEPVHGHEAISPEASPDQMNPLFAQHQQHAYSSDSVPGSHYYGAGTGGHADSQAQEFSDDIPLKANASNQQLYDAPPDSATGAKGTGALVGEAAMSPEELAREERRQRRRRARKPPGILHRVAWVCWFMTLVQLAVFIGQLVRYSVLTGSPIQTKPQFNPMIGPSPYNSINMGARYVPCIKDPHTIDSAYDKDYPWPCPNTTTSVIYPNSSCSLAELCGMSAGPDDYPLYQWWRFITPIFLHAGIVHIGFNLLLQMTLGREIEHLIGSIRFLIVYLASGIFGFVLGGNFAGPLLPSVGCSGSLFGITAISLLDLLYTWHKRQRPWLELMFIIIEIVISFALGLLPGLDNFSHIGGFLTGLVLGMCILRSPDKLRKRIRPKSMSFPTAPSPSDESPTSPTDKNAKQRAGIASFGEFTKKPVGFFQNRKPLWWAWWLVRAGCLVAVIVTFFVLLTNFYNNTNNCSWCRYLSCLPVNGWCDIGRVANSSSSSNRRDLLFDTALTGGF